MNLANTTLMPSSLPFGDGFLSLGDYSRAKAFFAWKRALDNGDTETVRRIEELAQSDAELRESLEAHRAAQKQDAA